MKNRTDYISSDSCNSLAQLFQLRVAKSPSAIAYRFYQKETDNWQAISWAKMAQIAASWRLALQGENIKKGDRVAIMLGNSPEWVAFEQAALSLGLTVVPLYANDRPDNIAYILNHTESRLLLCPGATFWEHLAPTIEQVTGLQRILTKDSCKTDPSDKRISCLSDWLPKSVQEETWTPITADIASIVYTSGTTGLPKGVMLSHQNILGNSDAGLQCMDIYPNDSFLSFLPLSHMLERTAGYYLPMMAGASVSFARSIPDLAEDLLTLQPTVLVAVPRIFEKIYSGIKTKLKSKPDRIQKLFKKSVDTGYQSFLYRQKRQPWTASLLFHPLLDTLIAKKVRAKLGGKLRTIITGGAPLSAEISKFFIGLGLPLYQGYGLTETSPVISVNRPGDNRPEGVGLPLPGVEIMVGEDEELLVKGSCVMLGYWKNQAATDQTVDKDGWLHTGDKVEIIDGHIRITGRLKDIIVLSTGEKVALADLEMAISLDPLFEHTIVVGEGRPYLTVFSVLNTPLWEELAQQLEIDTNAESLLLPEVHDHILKRLEKLLAHFPGYVYVKEVSLSLTPWTVENGLLTPTLKIKRVTIEKKMAEQIEKMYPLNS